jgi:hypothetical protein
MSKKKNPQKNEGTPVLQQLAEEAKLAIDREDEIGFLITEKKVLLAIVSDAVKRLTARRKERLGNLNKAETYLWELLLGGLAVIQAMDSNAPEGWITDIIKPSENSRDPYSDGAAYYFGKKWDMALPTERRHYRSRFKEMFFLHCYSQEELEPKFVEACQLVIDGFSKDE